MNYGFNMCAEPTVTSTVEHRTTTMAETTLTSDAVVGTTQRTIATASSIASKFRKCAATYIVPQSLRNDVTDILNETMVTFQCAGAKTIKHYEHPA